MTEEEPVGDCGACAKPAQLRCHLALASWNSVTWSSHNGDDLSPDVCTSPDQNMMPTIMKRCSGCRLVAYCNAQCQKEHRSEHKDECRLVESKYLSIIAQVHYSTSTSTFQLHISPSSGWEIPLSQSLGGEVNRRAWQRPLFEVTSCLLLCLDF